MKKLLLFLLVSLLVSTSSEAQNITDKYARFLTPPHGYVACRTQHSIKVDGVLDEQDWEKAVPITDFTDISGEGFPEPRYKTWAKMMWDDNYLYIGAFLEEPNVWAKLTQRDAIVYNDPDFEVFIDPDGDGQNYFEIEANAIATIFDLFLQKPYRAPHRAFVTFSWDTQGMLIDTHIYGTLNDSRDIDKGWSVEMAIPHEAIAAEFDNCLKAGNYLRIGFSRVEWQTETDADGKTIRRKDAAGKLMPEDNWTWGPTGMVAMHMPERWGYVYLSDSFVGEKTADFRYPNGTEEERLLWAMFYEQNDRKEKTGKYIKKTSDFRLTKQELSVIPEGAKLTVEATSEKFEITIHYGDGRSASIDENGFLCRRNNK